MGTFRRRGKICENTWKTLRGKDTLELLAL